MKKTFFTFCAIAFSLPLSLIAQPITIGASNAAATTVGVEVDSIGVVTIDTSFVPPVLSADTNYVWDMTHMHYTSYYSHVYEAGIIPYQYMDSIKKTWGPIHYASAGEYFFTVQGKQEHGQSLTAIVDSVKRAHDTATISFAAQATYLFDPNQNLTYYTAMPFPLTYRANDSMNWHSDYHTTYYFTMWESDTSMHIGSNSPAACYLTNQVHEEDTAIGWGKMKVNSAVIDTTTHMLKPSVRLFHVLQVKRVTTYHDSIHCAAGFQKRILDSLGIHGSTSNANGVYANNTYTVYEQDFYTRELMSPLAKIVFTDASMTVVQSAEVNVGNLARIDTVFTTGIPAIANTGNKLIVYPNPAVNGSITLEIQHPEDGNWAYELLNVSGQKMAFGALPFSNTVGSTHVQLPSACTPGMYFIRVSNNGNQVVSTPILISK